MLPLPGIVGPLRICPRFEEGLHQTGGWIEPHGQHERRPTESVDVPNCNSGVSPTKNPDSVVVLQKGDEAIRSRRSRDISRFGARCGPLFVWVDAAPGAFVR